jgi:translocation and assembly module TamA
MALFIKFPDFQAIKGKLVFRFWITFLSVLPLIEASYDVLFEGIEDREILTLIEEISQLEKLKDSSPSTVMGLKKRAEADIAVIRQALHSLAFYGTKIDFTIQEEGSKVHVAIDLGPKYPLAAFNIRYIQDNQEYTADELLDAPIDLCQLNIELGAAALPETILLGEDSLLDELNLRGYAFAEIKKRDVFVDQKNHNVIVWIVVDLGPRSYFGPVTFKGLERVNQSFFFRKLRWMEGALYNPTQIEKTQEALELSGLFRSVNISLADNPIEGDLIPIEISVLEAKQRSIGFGVNFTTQLGPGGMLEWEDRNILGDGEKLSFRADIWEKLQNGLLSYTIPDFIRQDQNLTWLVDYHYERNKSFIENTTSISGIIERKLTEKFRFSYGGMYKYLRSQRSARDGIFDLVKIPLQLRWNNVDSLLDPTHGGTIQLKAVPTMQIFSPQFAYTINTFTGTYYQPLNECKSTVFASKFMFGNILGASKHDIPAPERFYAGSENTLRGYRYMTVSPLGKRHHKPIGGRSLLIYSLELRTQPIKDFGIVYFYDIGNVYRGAYPEFNSGMLQSLGLGIRYYTPIGPLRLDFAVPLNRRSVMEIKEGDYSDRKKHRHMIDNPLELYFSIGQSF